MSRSPSWRTSRAVTRPATRPRWLRHRYLLLGAQAALTYVPFAAFGANWTPSGWLAGLVLLTVPAPASWFAAAILAALEEAVWTGVAGPGTPAAVWGMISFVFDALILFGLARLADLVEDQVTCIALELLLAELHRSHTPSNKAVDR